MRIAIVGTGRRLAPDRGRDLAKAGADVSTLSRAARLGGAMTREGLQVKARAAISIWCRHRRTDNHDRDRQVEVVFSASRGEDVESAGDKHQSR